jgi:uncharacterized protein (TIGR00730 family)
VNKFKRIAIFCGSNIGADPVYPSVCEVIADTFASENISLVYGGAKVGVMGLLADAMLKRNVEVIGVIPQKIAGLEVAHENLTELHIVESMHVRKALMAELADGFIMLPGGTGSLEEFFEIYTWAQLHYHDKPCGILNVNNYFDHLIKFMDVMLEKKFIRPENRNMMLVDACPEALLKKFVAYQPPTLMKWLTMEQVRSEP